MKHRTLAIVWMALSMVLVVVAIVLSLVLWDGGTAEQPDPDGPGIQAPSAATAGPGQTGDQTAGSGRSGPVVPAQDAPMGSAYFADAAFLGNGVTACLKLYDNYMLLPHDDSHWFCSDTLTVMGASPYVAQMPADTFGKVYIGLGIYELNYQRETLRAAFNAIVEQVKTSQPNAIIYLMSVTPVSKWCDENRGYRRSSVQSFNSMLQDIARQQQVWYLDVYPELCGEDGFLPSDVTPDGIEFNPDHYQKWFEYMKTHYVPDGTPPEPAAEATETPEDSAAPSPTAAATAAPSPAETPPAA